MTANNMQFTKIEIRIATYLFKHYNNRYNARQLARVLNINHAYSNKLCNILVNKQILIKEVIGNASYFTYNYENRFAIKFIEYILSLEEMEFPKWLTVLLHSLKKLKPYIEIGLVFGSSIIKKDFQDADVLLVYENKKLKEIENIKKQIRKSQLIEQPIRYVDISKRDIFLNRNDKVFYSIMAENLIFHNPEKYVIEVKKCRK